MERLEAYLQELLSLAVGVFEEPNFSYNAQTSKFLLTGVICLIFFSEI